MKILHHECITVCACYRYCHEKCLLLELNKQNTHHDEQIFKCSTCSKLINVHYRMDVVTKPHFSKLNCFIIITALLLLPLAIYAAILFQNNLAYEVLDSMVVTALASLLTYAIINSFMVREYTAISVKSTQLGLMISAFVEL